MGAVRVPINGDTLRWAREIGQVQLTELAKAVNVRVERILAFEDGTSEPTFNQLTAISRKLGRPVASFFCEKPADSGIPTTVDFRGASGPTSSKLVKTLKRLEEHRLGFLELEPEPPKLGFQFEVSSAPKELAKSARAALGLADTFVPKTNGPTQTFDFWRNILGESGILVFQTSGIDIDVFRGLSVYHDRLPLIVVNGGDSNAGRIFTLFHEYGHLLERTSGVCGSSEAAPIEVRCNQFAQEFLMPAEAVGNLVLTGDYKALVDQVSKFFKVSKLAAAIRLRSLHRITETEVSLVREQSDEEWATYRASLKAAPGGPAWHKIRYRDLGSHYVGAVARGLESKAIGLLDATYLLDAKVPAVSKILEEHMRSGAH